jgi:curli biogenesis system outer membrane secretion channel CsgG
MIIKRFVILILTFSFLQNLHAKTVEVEIIAEAEGVTYEHAVKKALATAVSKVTGMSVESSSSVVTSSIKIANNSQNLSSKGMTTNDATSVKTRGYINSYEIISKKQTKTNNYKVKVKAIIYQYKKSKSSNRIKIALLPTKSDKTVSHFFSENNPSEVVSDINTKLEQLLVQSRKFAVLSRQELSEMSAELSLIASNSTPIREKAKLGQILGADVLFLSVIDRADVRLKSSISEITGQNNIEVEGGLKVSVKVIDTVTSEVKYSRSFLRTADKISTADSLMHDLASEIINDFVERIYPIRVVNISENKIIINIGSDIVKVGQVFQVFKIGEQVFDPYTKESLGVVEKKIGTFKIVEVNPRKSYGVVVSGSGFEEGMIVRKAETKTLKEQNLEKSKGVKIGF